MSDHNNAGETMGDVDTQTGGQTGGQTGENANDAPEGMREIDLLKTRAGMMGINFSNNIGVDALKKKIQDKLEGIADNGEKEMEAKNGSLDSNVDNVDFDGTLVRPNPLAGEKPGDKPKTLREWVHDENMKLVRLRITNLDPKKKDLPGEVLTVANEYLGTVRKFIPYGEQTDGGYHVPWCLYEFMRARRFLNIRVSKKNGQEHVSQGWSPEFSLEILDQLTEHELNQLAQAQIAAGSVENNPV